MYTYANFDRRRNEKNKSRQPAETTLGKQIKLCRKADGYSLKEVAAYLHKSPQTLYKYEHDILSIPYKDLTMLALLYLRSMEFFCLPLYNEFRAQKKSTAALLLKYTEYSNKFYHADSYFPDKSEYSAIAAIAGYALLAIPHVL